VPFADSTLIRVPGSDHSDGIMRSLLALCDVMGTGHYAAVCAGVSPGSVVAVVGDGAVGLCGVIAARRLGAAPIIALSRNATRQELARSFGATDILAERGGDAPVRTYIPEFLADALEGRIDPGRVFDFETDLESIAEAYAAMDERRAVKALVRMGTADSQAMSA
jgi:threonine dehydrogenase-like Zn-dependent dehydrogenase